MTQYLLGLTQLLGHGRAFSEVLTVAKPAAGASGFTYTNSGAYWELLDSFSFRLVTDANVANRGVTVKVNDASGAVLVMAPPPIDQAAAITFDYCYAPQISSNNAGQTAGMFPLPSVWLQPGFTVTVTIGSVQVGDQVSNIRLYAERFVTGPQGYRVGMVDEADRREEALIRLSELLA